MAASRPRGEADGLIAASTMVHNLIIVTRNVGDFDDTRASVLNPWDVPTGLRPTLIDETEEPEFMGLAVMAGHSPSKDGRFSERPIPGHPRGPTASTVRIRSHSARQLRAAQKPSHVDGRDKPRPSRK